MEDSCEMCGGELLPFGNGEWEECSLCGHMQYPEEENENEQ